MPGTAADYGVGRTFHRGATFLGMELVSGEDVDGRTDGRGGATGRVVASAMGRLLTTVGELDRREAWRTEGATSSAAWLTERLGVAEGTGRSWSQVAESLWDMPHLAQGLRVGALSFDKVRVAVELATPETDARSCARPKSARCASCGSGPGERGTTTSRPGHAEYRYLRFNDARRTITAQLSEDAYAEVRGAVTSGPGCSLPMVRPATTSVGPMHSSTYVAASADGVGARRRGGGGVGGMGTAESTGCRRDGPDDDQSADGPGRTSSWWPIPTCRSCGAALAGGG